MVSELLLNGFRQKLPHAKIEHCDCEDVDEEWKGGHLVIDEPEFGIHFYPDPITLQVVVLSIVRKELDAGHRHIG